MTTLNKRAMIAMMIAATGLTTSMAAAQFKVEYSAKAEAAQKAAPEIKSETHKNSVMVWKTTDGDHQYEVKLVNGQVQAAKVDGDVQDSDQIKVEDETLIFYDDDGKVIYELKLDGLHGMDEIKKHRKTAWVTTADGKVGSTRNKGVFVVDGKALQNTVDTHFEFKAEHPKVMLGINLAEPSAALRKHLQLKDGVQVILVEKTMKGLPAALAGVQDFDVIVSIDGSDQASGEILTKILSEKNVGDKVKLVLLRGGEKVKLKVDLKAFDPQLMGVVHDVQKDDNRYPNTKLDYLPQIEIISEQLESGDFGNIQGLNLDKLKDRLMIELSEANGEREIAFTMRAKAMDAMKHAERQMVELREGRLFVHSSNEFREHAEHLQKEIHELHEQMPRLNQDALREHVGGQASSHMSKMEERLESLESRLDRQIDEMSKQVDRLAEMFERLIDKLEDED